MRQVVGRCSRHGGHSFLGDGLEHGLVARIGIDVALEVRDLIALYEGQDQARDALE
jgi:hypothetical protein